jgi:hypothetical protein
MDSEKNQFLSEIEADIRSRATVRARFQVLQIGLMSIIAGCGFLTAAASQTETKTTWVSMPTSLLIFGLMSAICAIINQILNPSDRCSYHRSARKALEYVRGEVKYRGMPVKDAERLRALASTNPEFVLGKLPQSDSAIAPNK